MMKLKDKIRFWQEQAEEDYAFAKQQYKLKNYLWCLFACQLCLEKAIKSLVIKATQQEPPRIHNLVYLARLAEIELSDKQKDELIAITSFSIEARYPEYKQKLKKLANKKYALNYFEISGRYLKWFLRNA